LDSSWISTASDVFSSVGTVGAFLVGFILLRQEHHREAGRTEDDRRAQAERISAWVELTRSAEGIREVAFHVHNASDMPIYEVELPIPARADEEASSEFVGLVPPGRTVQRPAPADWIRTYVEPEPVQIEFLDSAGRRWSRDEQGALTRSD
jgi:hypothetical protein